MQGFEMIPLSVGLWDGGNCAQIDPEPVLFYPKGDIMKKIIAILLMILMLSGCSVPEPEVEGFTFNDDLGREVTVTSTERVACLIGSFADIWYLAGGVDSIVAAAKDTWTYFDLPLKEDVVNLGGTKELDLEQLIACEPDFIIASCNTAAQVDLQETFDTMGMTVAYFDVSTFEDYLRVLKLFTQITDVVELYRLYGEMVSHEVDRAIARADGSRPSVLYIRASGSSVKVKNSEGSVLGEMLRDLDCRNIADSQGSLLEQLSMEVILQEDPDFIFLIMQSADPSAAEQVVEATLLSNPAWNSLTAVREGRFHVLDQTLYNLKPNERWGEAYDQLAQILYP